MNSNNFNRDKWKNRIISDVATEINQRIENPHLSEYEKFIGLEDFESGVLELKKWNRTEIVKSAMKIFQKGDVLFARRNAYLKRASFVNFNGVCSGDALVIRPKENEITSKYLSITFNSDKLWNYAIANAAGTMSKRIKWRDLAVFLFSLPPLEEQKRITDMLYKIEDAIEQNEQQQKSLIQFKKGLLNKLFQENGSLGNLIMPEDCKKVRFGDVTIQVKTNISPADSGLERFVAGEHMQTDDLKIRSWGEIGEEYIGSAFTRKFNKGHVLYGSRRTYLRKVAVAEFDGICANTTFIIEAKKDIFSQRLLPYLMHSESFTLHSISNSKGSTNPYINWKDIAWFEFPLPNIILQEKAANLFENIDKVIEQTKQHKEKLIAFKKGLLNELIG
ncbi:restriction endonuclease subunit S [candidate division KSB1 bacterium]|nr:restriction endonuclease subunit S [candidate division KSB1 bacterium]